ncbi:hypothetical protein [Novosphingobium nitrogenifigens]|uniref:hypothetical protein n=1 Tax=Novosphingobium nitrogenifigens TaxID=378548 RepID=UPI0003639548|nr:hypothetical protein [Novosphingobium nitrogenifigens]
MTHASHLANLAFPEEGKEYPGEMIDLFSKALQIDQDARREFNLSLLSHEFRLILQVLVNKSFIMKDAWLSSTLSNRAFHEMIKRLENNNIVQCEKKSEDKRAKEVMLSKQISDWLNLEIAKNTNN